jgi:hypothetical protein
VQVGRERVVEPPPELFDGVRGSVGLAESGAGVFLAEAGDVVVRRDTSVAMSTRGPRPAALYSSRSISNQTLLLPVFATPQPSATLFTM